MAGKWLQRGAKEERRDMKMTWLEALNEVAKGKKMRQKAWGENSFLFLLDDIIYMSSNGKSDRMILGDARYLKAYDWEEYEQKMDFLSACRLLIQDRTRKMRRACWPEGMVLKVLPDGLTYNGFPWEDALSEMLATDWVVF